MYAVFTCTLIKYVCMILSDFHHTFPVPNLELQSHFCHRYSTIPKWVLFFFSLLPLFSLSKKISQKSDGMYGQILHLKTLKSPGWKSVSEQMLPRDVRRILRKRFL